MPTLDDAFDAVCTALIRQFGPAADDFEGLTPFETMIAVVLDRGFGAGRWRAGFDGLAEDGLLSPDRLANADFPEIGDALREKGAPAAARTIASLKRLARWVVDQRGAGNPLLDADESGHAPASLARLREELGAIKGIGPAAADALVLFALKRPSYPVDRATFRVLVRHGWLDSTASYDEAHDLVVDRAIDAEDEREDQAVPVLANLSHGMERLGRQFCRAAAPHCHECPLEHLLPEGGPREVDA